MSFFNSNGEGPRPGGERPSPIEQQRAQVLRVDRIYGVVLFAIGIIATINMMLSSTEQVLVTAVSQYYSAYGLGDYVRPEGLATIEWTGIILHPLNYALWLYFALRRWRAKKTAAWFAAGGAIVAWILSTLLTSAALLAHPDLLQAMMEQGFPPAPTTPAPTAN